MVRLNVNEAREHFIKVLRLKLKVKLTNYQLWQAKARCVGKDKVRVIIAGFLGIIDRVTHAVHLVPAQRMKLATTSI